MPLQATSGAASYDAFGGGAASVPQYIEDVFSTYLYTGNASTQTITNGIDLSGKGGLVWLKARTANTQNFLFDTTRGALNEINSSTTDAQASLASSLTAFNSTGFNLDSAAGINVSAINYTSWSFRKQSKFFDIVTYTGTGANRTIAHNLGSVPGSIFVKRTDTTANWQVYHRSLGNTDYVVLNSSAAVATGATRWNSTTPTSTVFSVGTDITVNDSGGTYVAYIFAHDAGGFGLTGTDNVISCGSFTTDAGGLATVNLGYEPQWVILKSSNLASNWTLTDNMRGFPTPANNALLIPNTFGTELVSPASSPTATGFNAVLAASSTYIYIAIRRGPMKVPTVGTSVFAPVDVAVSSSITVTTGFPVDMSIGTQRQKVELANNYTFDRLRGSGKYLSTNNTNGESGTGTTTSFNTSMTAYIDNYSAPVFGETSSYGTNIYWNFRRAPSFFDEVCYTGTGANTNVTHNLGAVPELMIIKRRDDVGDWDSYSATLAATEYIVLNTTAAKATGATRWNSTRPTSSVFRVGTSTTVNASAGTYVAYLFATCVGVSKVGSYTGNGTTQTIDCGFGAGGARFVLIKRTDSIGDWYVYDTARGMTVLTDPYLRLNSTAAEVATLGSVTTVSTGFALNSTILAAINVNAGTYIFLAIA